MVVYYNNNCYYIIITVIVLLTLHHVHIKQIWKARCTRTNITLGQTGTDMHKPIFISLHIYQWSIFPIYANKQYRASIQANSKINKDLTRRLHQDFVFGRGVFQTWFLSGNCSHLPRYIQMLAAVDPYQPRSNKRLVKKGSLSPKIVTICQ